MQGKWIWLNQETKNDTYAEFVGEFKPKSNARIEISADTEYAIYVNDTFVYAGQYADFPWYKVYDKIDITKYLKAGENTFSVQVWYQGDYNFCHYVATPRVCFDIISDDKVIVSSGKETKSRLLPYFVNEKRKLITQQIGYSFSLDYTMEKREFQNSKEIESVYEPTLRKTELLRFLPKKTAKKIADNVYDLGEETVGLFYMEVNSSGKVLTTISFSEHLIKDEVPRIIGGRDFSFEVTSCGKQEVFNPFRKIGCRYLQVDSDADIIEIGVMPCEYPFKLKDNLLNLNSLEEKIYNTSIKTLKLNAFEHYYDCPWREQAFYALDSRFQMRYGYTVFNNNEYQYAALKLMSEDRNATKMISITVPTSCTLVIPSFSLFYIVAMEEYAEYTKDTSLIAKYYPKLKEVLNVFIENIKEDLVQNFFGKDFWNFYEWNPTLDNVSYPYDCALNLTFLIAVKSMIKVCELLRNNDIEYYNRIYTRVKERINKEFYSEKDGLYYTTKDVPFSELVNSYAILTDVADGIRAKTIAEKLADKNSGLIPCTLSMLSFKYDALFKASDDYGKYIIDDINKNYKYMLEHGATSFWETLKGAEDFDGAGSLCHGWSALPIYYYNKLKRGK
ncbi:MAG: hypothetical protein SPJ19_02255 [Candidatus Borkfalkiaceae bacterium]|nr:hypothetical protein [Christensenellaceae bacterium]